MGTRAAAFTAKIHNLQDYNARIQHGILPLPSGVDVANTLKYFSQTLLSVLKDVPSISLDVLRSPEKDHARTSLFPSLDYKGLYHAIVELVDAVPLVQHGAHALGHTVLHTLSCLVPFLEHEYMDTLPYLVASSMALFPSSLHKDIVDMLCNHLLPFTFIAFPAVENQNYASMSTAAVLMMIFQYTDCSAYHCQVLECLMSLKKDIIKDLLCVIAHGTAKARCHAVELLFQYLPTLNPALLDRKGIGNKLNGWKALLCQRENCVGTVSNEAVKMCFNHSIAIGSGEQPPPLYVCEECAVDITLEHGPQHMTDVLLPMDKVSVTCENKDCKGSDKSAIATCFSVDCASQNGHRPIRYCFQCHILYHNEERGVDHIVHTTIPSPWNMDRETQSYMVEAIINLLREAEPVNEKHTVETIERPYQSSLQDGEDNHEVTTVEERQLLSRYGIWLLVGLCTPTEDTPVESLGRLLSMLFQWFHYTACLPDDQAGNALERLKAEYIHGWLMEVVKSHFEVFVSCLIPHPVDYAQVGGHWETWPSHTNQIKEGFKRLLCLVPYDIITSDVWEYIMPYWMEAFRHEIPEGELAELKILLSKILDPDISPLGFDTKKMYKFLCVRFESSITSVQEQALSWLQILTLLEVPVPLDLLFDMFMTGVESTAIGEEEDISSTCHVIPPPDQHHLSSLMHSRIVWSPGQSEEPADDYTQAQEQEYKTDGEINLACYILMLDIIIKQMELQEIPLHKGLEQKDSQRVLMLLRDIIKAPWLGIHTCSDPAECNQCICCEVSAIWFQLCLVLIEYFCPVMEVTMADIPVDIAPPCQMSFDQQISVQDHSEQLKTDSKNDSIISVFALGKDDNHFQQPTQKLFSDDMSESDVMGEISPIQTATVQECAPELDTVAIMPTEKVVAAFAREITLTEDDVAGAKCTVASAVLVDENDQTVSQTLEDSTFWPTSEGRFKFTIEELPPQLQFFFVLIKGLADHKDADVLYHILSCLKVMCLHAEVLNKAAHSHRGFLIWCQENLLITNMWKLLQTEFSHIAQLATSLLLHCITLPCGADMFWKILEQDFHNDTWRSRYAAVEKVTMIAHFVEPTTVKNSPLLQSSLANAFCYLVHCLDDIQPTVAQRALLNLETIKTASLKLLLWCLEVQFDSTIVDRPMILQTIYQLYNHLSSRRFLTWEFFLNRFDALFLEAQINLEKTGELSYTRDLKNTNTNSEMFQRKLNRAHEALSLVNTSRSLTVSFGTKWPYKRAMSAPGGMMSKQEKWIDKEKIYGRQSSAPVLKRKSSKLIASAIGPLGPLQHFPNSFFPDGHMKEIMQEETHFLNVLHRGMEMEDHDRDTLHLLIFLLMQFLSRPDPSHPLEEKVLTRSQHIVVKHLNILLGYSQTERKFLIPAYKVRCSAVFNAFLMSMPRVLDYNFSMGNIILNSCLSLLVYCPSPQKYAHEHYSPSYSLWLLEPYCRHSWLLSTLVIMYKYHYDSYSQSRHIQLLITIVLNTLEAQRHKCRHSHEPLLSPLPSRSRDLSTASADTENVQEKEKELPFDTAVVQEDNSKPFVGAGFKLKGFSSKSITTDTTDGEVIIEQLQKLAKDKNERQQWKTWKIPEMSCSSDGEDAEPELEAIPESPKSENSEQEQCLSELTCIPQMTEQACVRVVKDSFPSKDQVVVTDPWSTISNEATVVLNTDNLKASLSYESNSHKSNIQRYTLPESPPSLQLHSVDDNHIIEKAALEVMEKHMHQIVDLQNSAKQREFDAITDIDTDILNEKIAPSVKTPQPNPFYMQLKTQTTTTPGVQPQLDQMLFNFHSVMSEHETASNRDFLSVKECHQVGEITSSRAQMNSISAISDKTEDETKINTYLPGLANISKKGLISTSEEVNNSCINFKGFNSKGSHNVEVTKVCSLIPTSVLCSHAKKYNEKDSVFETEVNKDVQKKERSHSDVMLEKDCERNTSHPKYPKSKLFLHSKKRDHDKIPWRADVLGSANLTVPIFRPPLERLLPIGMPEKEKVIKLDLLSTNQMNYSFQQPPPSQPSEQDSTFLSNRDLFEDKGVQTEQKDLSLGIPAPERLLPVGPLPSRKDGCITSTFKTKWEDCAKEKVCTKIELLATSSELSGISETFPVSCNRVEDKIQKSLNYQKTEKLGASSIAHPLFSKHNTEEHTDFSNDFTKINKNNCLSFDSSFKTGIEVTIHKTLDHESKEILNNISTNRMQTINSKKMESFSESFSPKKIQTTSELKTLYDVACKNTAEIMAISGEQVNIPEVLYGKEVEITGNEIHHQNNGNSTEILPSEKVEVLESKHDEEVSQRHSDKAPEDDVKCKLHYRQRKQRKSGISTIEAQRSLDLQNSGMRRMRKIEVGSISSMGLTSKRSSTSQSSSARYGEDVVVERCTDCGAILEEYSDEELGLCIVILATFVHREPTIAAPLLPEMLRIVARIASSTSYPWQSESNIHLPGGSVSVARQFLRCTLHQLAPNGVFIQIFQSHSIDSDFFKTMAAALADFTEVNQVTPLLLLFENLNDRKHLHHESVFHILDNVAVYLDCLPVESNLPPWNLFLQQLELFLRKFLFTLSAGPCHLNNVIHIMLSALKMPIINSTKSILDPFSKILSHAIQHSALDYHQLSDLCHFCYRNLSRERDKLVLTRTAIFELVQALKFKSSVPDANLLMLVQFVLEDSGGSLGPSIIVEGLPYSGEMQIMYNTSASECMRQYLNDALEFVADIHTLTKVKNMLYGTSTHLNEETLGGQLKAGIAQYLAIEISKGNGRDNRAIGRYLPWLYHPPTSLQQGPKEFIDCVAHIRLLSWLLLGALIHSALLHSTAAFVCQPIPLEANSHIAEHIQVILAGFAEQSKVSVLHMSSLFHAFILCQLWTMYCEHMVSLNPPGSEQNQVCCLTLTDFWAKITPGILQLVCHSKVLAEMVSLHFLSLMEALLECNSTVLARLLPMWTPVLYSFQGQLPGHLHVRLHSCLSWQPPSHTREEVASISNTFLKWLQRLHFKMGQIELQSSTATQFYSL